MSKQIFEVWLAVNDDGDAGVSLEGGDEARDALVAEFGGAAVRTVKLTVQMAVPEVIEAEVEVRDEAGETQEVKAEAA